MAAEQLTDVRTPAGGRARPNLTRINAWFDLALGGLMAGVSASAYLDTPTHIVLGAATLVAIPVHMALHWRWIVAAARRLRQLPLAARRKALLGLLLLLAFAPLALSGVVVALIYAPGVSAFHTAAAYLFAGLMLPHLALSRQWIAARLRRTGGA